MSDLKRKLSSRKLWAAIVGIVTGLAMIFGLDESTISSVAGGVVSMASIITYIITEGKVDAAAVKPQEVQENVQVLGFEIPSGENDES